MIESTGSNICSSRTEHFENPGRLMMSCRNYPITLIDRRGPVPITRQEDRLLVTATCTQFGAKCIKTTVFMLPPDVVVQSIPDWALREAEKRALSILQGMDPLLCSRYSMQCAFAELQDNVETRQQEEEETRQQAEAAHAETLAQNFFSIGG